MLEMRFPWPTVGNQWVPLLLLRAWEHAVGAIEQLGEPISDVRSWLPRFMFGWILNFWVVVEVVVIVVVGVGLCKGPNNQHVVGIGCFQKGPNTPQYYVGMEIGKWWRTGIRQSNPMIFVMRTKTSYYRERTKAVSSRNNVSPRLLRAERDRRKVCDIPSVYQIPRHNYILRFGRLGSFDESIALVARSTRWYQRFRGRWPLYSLKNRVILLFDRVVIC